jgi:hypothetical protein
MASLILGWGALALVMVFAFAYIATRRGPLRTVILALLHLQAAIFCLRVVLRSGTEVWGQRYRECLEIAKREAGR